MKPLPASWIKFFFWIYLLFLVFSEATVNNPADPDLWHRLALGETLWKTHHFPNGDASSYLADYKRVDDHEWGSALLFYALDHYFSANVFVWVKIVTLAITLILLARAGLGEWRPTILSAAFYMLVLLALLPSFQSTVRCMIFTHLFFALWLYWFQREKHGESIPLPAYFLTMLIWANLHGGFVIGLGWLLLVSVTQAFYGGSWQKWMVRFAACCVATLMNPFGWHLWISTARALVTTRRGFNEWAPVPWLTQPTSYPGYKLLLIGVVVFLALLIHKRGWKRVNRPVVLCVGAFLVFSFFSARHTSLFAAACGALLPDLCPPIPPHQAVRNRFYRNCYAAARIALIMIPLSIALFVLPGAGLKISYPKISAPVGAVDYLKQQNIHGKLLVPFNYGSYALWQLRGRMRVSMDGRYELVYRPETFLRVENFFAANGDWQNLLTNPAPDAVLVRKSDGVYEKLKNLPKWKEVYGNETDAVFLAN